MIRFILTRGHAYTLQPVKKFRRAPAISLMNYDALIRARWLRRATYVFTDLDWIRGASNSPPTFIFN
jgi:hypothetical protein